MTYRDIICAQFNWLPQVLEHFGSRGYQPNMEADNVPHTILTPEQSKVSDEIWKTLYNALPPRFWINTELTDSCWIWIGARSGGNYGWFQWEGKGVRPHRLVWSILFGEIPEKMMICHKCDNPPCFNPSHLFIGTRSDNQKDSARKRRSNFFTNQILSSRGEDRYNAKLTDEEVREIKMELARGTSVRAIARIYPAGRSTITRIKKGLQWAHITI